MCECRCHVAPLRSDHQCPCGIAAQCRHSLAEQPNWAMMRHFVCGERWEDHHQHAIVIDSRSSSLIHTLSSIYEFRIIATNRMTIRAIFLASFLPIIAAYLQYSNRAETGPQYGATGKAEYCGTGTCKDGTIIGRPGQCYGYMSACTDVNPAPRCAANQVLDGMNCGPCGGVDSGSGRCYINGYQWQKSPWTWHCYDCLDGYISVSLGRCAGSPYWDCMGHYPPGPCVRCSEPDESLGGNPDSGWWCSGPNSGETPPTCTRSPQPASNAIDCAITRAISDLVGGFGDISTLLGALCTTDEVSDVLTAGASLIMGYAQVVNADAASLGSAKSSFALAIEATASSIALTLALPVVEGLFPEAAVFAAVYKTACLVDGAAGLALGALGLEALDDAKSTCAAVGPAKRGVFSKSLITHPGQGVKSHRRQAIANMTNPCTTFLDYFSTELAASILAVEDACDKVAQYLPGDTSSNQTAHALTLARQQCDQIYSTFNLPFLGAFATFIDAVADFEPYCAITTNSSTTTAANRTLTSAATGDMSTGLTTSITMLPMSDTSALSPMLSNRTTLRSSTPSSVTKTRHSTSSLAKATHSKASRQSSSSVQKSSTHSNLHRSSSSAPGIASRHSMQRSPFTKSALATQHTSPRSPPIPTSKSIHRQSDRSKIMSSSTNKPSPSSRSHLVSASIHLSSRPSPDGREQHSTATTHHATAHALTSSRNHSGRTTAFTTQLTKCG